MANNKKADPKAGSKRKKHAKNYSRDRARLPLSGLDIGFKNPECACCRQPFDDRRRRAGAVRIMPPLAGLALGAFQFHYDLCAECEAAASADENGREAVLQKVFAYHMGDEVAHE